MLVVLAKALGMCFGVEDALGIAHSVRGADEVSILGEIVHNSGVQQALLDRGFTQQAERDRAQLPPQPAVLVTAHGISDAYRNRLKEAGKEIIDTTCPLVVRVHKTAAHLVKHGYRLLLVGKPGHVEVLGITEDHPDTVVVPSLGAVPSEFLGARLAVLAQTTTPPSLFDEVCAEVRRLHPDSEIRVANTICQPTRERQAAIGELLPRVHAVVVVGGSNSNNTLRLVEQARSQGLPCCRVENAEEVDPAWVSELPSNARVGLTAGTSTPREAIDAVHRKLLALDRGRPAAR